ncbi:hypothetical protein CPI83_30140 (plasmid) [Rhodococcus sp. H-CA8f]|nr:hypothetical protein CPI83_30140 [Rhodococcus sp. H-CA8f]
MLEENSNTPPSWPSQNDGKVIAAAPGAEGRVAPRVDSGAAVPGVEHALVAPRRVSAIAVVTARVVHRLFIYPPPSSVKDQATEQQPYRATRIPLSAFTLHPRRGRLTRYFDDGTDGEPLGPNPSPPHSDADDESRPLGRESAQR